MDIETLCVILGVTVAVIGVTSIIVLIALFRNDKNFEEVKVRDRKSNPASILIVVGAGGHCTEILKLMKALGDHYKPRFYVMANTDQMSEAKVKEFESTQDNEYHVYKIPRSREVMQSWITSVASTAYSILYSFPLVFKLKPEIILCNGPGTCVPVCLAGFILKLFYPLKIIYVESICRVETFSLSAKILYYLADHLVVNWPQVQQKFPKSLYLGRVL